MRAFLITLCSLSVICLSTISKNLLHLKLANLDQNLLKYFLAGILPKLFLASPSAFQVATVSCLHTFCESCIQTYILSSLKKEKEKTGISCPVCRKFVTFEGESGKQELWAKQLPKNHLIFSMINKNQLQRNEKLCSVCESNESKKATSWCVVCQEAFCSTCTIYHSKFKMSAKHKIVPLEDFQSDKMGHTITGLVFCDEHPEKKVKVYCKDHSLPCCTLCATINHRKCEEVVAIDKVTSGIKVSDECTNLVKELKTLSSNLKCDIDQKDKNIETFKGKVKEYKKEITEIKEVIFTRLSEIERKMKEKLDTKEKQVLLKLEDEATELSSIKCSVDNCIGILETCIKHGSDLQLLIELKKLFTKKKEITSDMEDALSKMKYMSLTFTPNNVIKTFTETVESFGEIKVEELNFRSKVSKRPNFNFQTGAIKVVMSIDVNDGNQQFNYVSGLWMGDDIILTDNTKSRVVKYDNKGNLLSELQGPTNPADITRVDDRTVAVASLSNNTINVINTNDMTIERTLQSAVSLYGLRYVDKEFIISRGDTISWINSTTGEKIEDRKTTGKSYFISASARMDYICGDGLRSISCTVGGSTKFTYTSDKLSSPRGVDTDMKGNIYICGFGSKNLHQISSDGKLIRIIQSSELGIESPWVIRLAENSNKFLLTSSDTGKVSICEIGN